VKATLGAIWFEPRCDLGYCGSVLVNDWYLRVVWQGLQGSIVRDQIQTPVPLYTEISLIDRPHGYSSMDVSVKVSLLLDAQII
jgi:hypothetical protein